MFVVHWTNSYCSISLRSIFNDSANAIISFIFYFFFYCFCAWNSRLFVLSSLVQWVGIFFRVPSFSGCCCTPKIVHGLVPFLLLFSSFFVCSLVLVNIQFVHLFSLMELMESLVQKLNITFHMDFYASMPTFVSFSTDFYNVLCCIHYSMARRRRRKQRKDKKICTKRNTQKKSIIFVVFTNYVYPFSLDAILWYDGTVSIYIVHNNFSFSYIL